MSFTFGMILVLIKIDYVHNCFKSIYKGIYTNVAKLLLSMICEVKLLDNVCD